MHKKKKKFLSFPVIWMVQRFPSSWIKTSVCHNTNLTKQKVIAPSAEQGSKSVGKSEFLGQGMAAGSSAAMP